MNLNLTVESMSVIHWYIYASHNSYADRRDHHIRAMMSPGRGPITNLIEEIEHTHNVRSLTKGGS